MMYNADNCDSSRSVRRLSVAFVALYFVVLAAPRIALTQAAADGLLTQTLTAADARERIVTNPESGDVERRALVTANVAQELPILVSPITSPTVVCDQYPPECRTSRGAAAPQPDVKHICIGGVPCLPNAPPVPGWGRADGMPPLVARCGYAYVQVALLATLLPPACGPPAAA